MVDHHRPLLPLPPRNTGRARALLTSLLGMLAVLSGLVILASWGSSGVLTTALRGASSRAVSVDGRVRWGQRPYRVSPASLRSFARKGKKEEESKYAGTVNLPVTEFQQRANAPKREPQIQKQWEDSGIYAKLAVENPGPQFTLHDGPPYANGDVHCGHALNKILKDVINRFRILNKDKVRYVPGWDCHGLPIELKVLQSIKSKERSKLTPIDIRKKARDFALETVEKQMESFKRFGCWGNWENPYLTLQPEFEAAQIEPVHWSPSSRTALAEAELEYPEGHTSRSIYVGFPVKEATEAVQKYAEGKELTVAIWTTTPWTIPANLAVAVNGDLSYSIVTNHDVLPNKNLIVATELIDSLAMKLGLDAEKGQKLEVLGEVKGTDLDGIVYTHPLNQRENRVVLGGDYITTESGTGLVHTAPGHGQEDYQTGQKYGLELLSPVDDAGRFTEEAGERLKGLSVLKEGNEEVIKALNESGTLLKEEAYVHKYPYDWRTKKPTIFRATSQWFASVDGFRDDALKAIENVKWVPGTGQNRMRSFCESRGDWCISRQRAWGVPIPVFYDTSSGEPLMNDETIQHVKEIVREKGTDAWWELSLEELMPESYQEEAKSGKWRKGTDTMDVWFDSGSSWNGVVSERDELEYPADIYFEGSDQHRGWFQSSLLTSVASKGRSPYKTVLTHGFVLDEKGYKMSKSLGNVIDPLEVIEGGNNKKAKPAYGADVLRLWAASVADSYRKLRNTVRYLIGNLHDFKDENAIPYEDLPKIDRYILSRLSETMKEVDNAYNTYNFAGAVQSLNRFCVSDLSNFYLDTAKDRLYIPAANSPRRRSCQTAVAPILPHMAEDLHLNMPHPNELSSIFETTWEVLEAARQDKYLGASLEAEVLLYAGSPETQQALERLMDSDNDVDELKYLLLVSGVKLVGPDEVKSCSFKNEGETETGVYVGVRKHGGQRCERCWNYFSEDSFDQDSQFPDACLRCSEALQSHLQKAHAEATAAAS
ncbi:hypothetical protein AAMO2058_001014700 [Amorphochlora amoebiformis]